MSKTITVRELKALLEGMDMLQGKTWVPNAQQWRKIRQKISQLEDEELVYVKELEEEEEYNAPQAPRPRAPMPTSAPPTSALDEAASTPAPTPLPNAARPHQTADGKTKTPDIDTSNGYNVSAFE